MTPTHRPFAVVTGGSSGIGLELARCAAQDGHDLLLAADAGDLDAAAARLRDEGAPVRTLAVDLSRREGIDALMKAIDSRPVDALFANAGHGLGKAFLDQDFERIRHVIDTNVSATVELVHRIGREMRARRPGRILLTDSIAGYMPGTYQAVDNATKAFVDSFAVAIHQESKDSGVSVTVLMPGATDTAFFDRADMQDTALGKGSKDDPAMVARAGYEAMMKGEAQVASGWKNKVKASAAAITPAPTLARQHEKVARPGSADD